MQEKVQAIILALKERYPDVYIGYSDHRKPVAGFDVIKTA